MVEAISIVLRWCLMVSPQVYSWRPKEVEVLEVALQKIRDNIVSIRHSIIEEGAPFTRGFLK
jgi:hypothetical protein